MTRLQEIEARLAAIAAELEARTAEQTAESLTALETEVRTLTQERATLMEQAAAERRTNLLSSIANGSVPANVVRNFTETRNSATVDRYDTPEYRRSFMQHVITGAALPTEFRTDAIATTTDVGAVIPTVVLNKIIEKLESSGMILPLITRTGYRGGVSIPVSSVKPTASWVGEGSGSTKQKHTIGKTGTVTFAYHKLRCVIAVTLEVETMAISAFEALLVKNIAEAMVKAIEIAIINGSGDGEPKGILTETPATGQVIESSAPGYVDLTAAEGALPASYEANAMWCMSKKTFMSYYGITDLSGQPIARVNYGLSGKPERYLLGRPVILCDNVTTYASNLQAGTPFGFLFDFKDYILNTNYNMGIKKYEDNDTDDQVTKAVMLVDGKVIDINSLVTLVKKS